MTQLVYGLVTLARCASLPFCKILTTTSRDFLSILTVDFPSLLRSLVNLTFGRKRCSESVVVSLLHLLLPCFYCPAHQVPWEDRKPYNKKRHTLRCAFTSISGFLSSQAVSSQVLSAFMSLTTVFEMGTGGSS